MTALIMFPNHNGAMTPKKVTKITQKERTQVPKKFCEQFLDSMLITFNLFDKESKTQIKLPGL